MLTAVPQCSISNTKNLNATIFGTIISADFYVKKLIGIKELRLSEMPIVIYNYINLEIITLFDKISLSFASLIQK